MFVYQRSRRSLYLELSMVTESIELLLMPRPFLDCVYRSLGVFVGGEFTVTTLFP